jgi:NADH-quinone oxidoreductase subunit K
MITDQLILNFCIFFTSIFGILYNQQNILIKLVCVELLLLSVNLNLVLFSLYLDDYYGQFFSVFVLGVAAAESAVGLAIIILYYRVRGSISLEQDAILKN